MHLFFLLYFLYLLFGVIGVYLYTSGFAIVVAGYLLNYSYQPYHEHDMLRLQTVVRKDSS